jgi:hypothetical protein
MSFHWSGSHHFIYVLCPLHSVIAHVCFLESLSVALSECLRLGNLGRKEVYLASSSGVWGIQKHGASTCSASAEGLVLLQPVTESGRVSGCTERDKTHGAAWFSNNWPSW